MQSPNPGKNIEIEGNGGPEGKTKKQKERLPK